MRICVVVSVLVLGACPEAAPESSPADATDDFIPAVFPDASADVSVDADLDADAATSQNDADATDVLADTPSDVSTVELPVDTSPRPDVMADATPDGLADATPDGLADAPAPDASDPDATDTTGDGGGCTGACVAGQTDTQTVPCGNCGAMIQTRSCDPLTCQWDPWVDGACLGEGVCAPGEELPGCDVSSAGSPTSCGVQVCTGQCNWGACEPAPGAQCLSESGSNFQCCTAPGGGSGWQFCSSTTCQWFPCEAHSCN